MDHNKLWKIPQEMDRAPDLPPEKSACRSRNNRIRHETMDLFKIREGVCQGCILPHCLFNLYAETSLSLFTFIHWRRKWQPTPVFLPRESQGWGSLVGFRLWGRTESDMTEQFSSSSSSRVHHEKRWAGRSTSWNQDAGRNINNLRYAGNTTLKAEIEEELKSLLLKLQEENEKAGLKLSIKKRRSWHLVLSLHGK